MAAARDEISPSVAVIWAQRRRRQEVKQRNRAVAAYPTLEGSSMQHEPREASARQILERDELKLSRFGIHESGEV